MNIEKQYDVIIVGGGHAGTEAALAAARVGADTLLLTHNIDTLGQMSCNPAIGGLGKSHLVKEIDALGGAMARAIDRSGIQFRVLNRSKGPAVRATRAQADRVLYRSAIRSIVENQENLTLFQQPVDDLIIENDQIGGVVTQMGLKIKAKTVVLTVGTFLGGKIYVGNIQQSGGRAGDAPCNALAAKLRLRPFVVSRLKTGTPPRIDGRTIEYSELEEQQGDLPLPVFSFLGKVSEHPEQISCHITYTNKKTHDIIRKNINRSAIFSETIEGIGPRYCPSIEDKVFRFADKSSHQIFIEPEGLTTNEVYPNGISTSLPFECQVEFIRSIKGFERAAITRPGYAIEYDFFDPRGLKKSLETKLIDSLFFAGQINGTTGYEEAAAQGLIAGLNAALKVQGRDAWCPTRSEAYIGVLIDDLTTMGTLEPYRMFTSRAEYRLRLREDNADERLTTKGYEFGLVSQKRYQAFSQKLEAIKDEQQRLKKILIRPNTGLSESVSNCLTSSLTKETYLSDLLARPDADYLKLMSLEELGPAVSDPTVAEQVAIQAKYAGYIERQEQEIERQKKQASIKLPGDLDYQQVSGLSNEVREKLIGQRPETLGHASRIPGVTPAAISILMIYLKKKEQVVKMREGV